MSDPMLKLYDKSPAKVLATLAAGAALRQDMEEYEKILSSAPRCKQIGPHPDFTIRKQAFLHIAALWAMLYWKNTALLQSFALVQAEEHLSPEKQARAEALATWHQSTIRALDAALDSLADNTGLDAAAVRTWAGSLPPDNEPLTEEEKEEAAAYTQAWLEVIRQ